MEIIEKRKKNTEHFLDEEDQESESLITNNLELIIPSVTKSTVLVEDGYILGNIQGWSYLNLLVSILGLLGCSVVFLFFCKSYMEKQNVDRMIISLFIIFLTKNSVLFIDLFFLIRANKYSFLSLVSLISSTITWTICLLVSFGLLKIMWYRFCLVDIGVKIALNLSYQFFNRAISTNPLETHREYFNGINIFHQLQAGLILLGYSYGENRLYYWIFLLIPIEIYAASFVIASIVSFVGLLFNTTSVTFFESNYSLTS